MAKKTATRPNAPIRLRPIQSGDIDRILEIEAQWNALAWSRTSFEAEIAHEFGITVVAVSGDEVVGYASAWLVIDEIHITTIGVDKEFHGLKIGTRLMKELLVRGKESGAHCSTLEVRTSNEPAINLYKALGYKPAGIRKRYYSNNREDALVMWLHELPS